MTYAIKTAIVVAAIYAAVAYYHPAERITATMNTISEALR
jgi:hypothetical protein